VLSFLPSHLSFARTDRLICRFPRRPCSQIDELDELDEECSSGEETTDVSTDEATVKEVRTVTVRFFIAFLSHSILCYTKSMKKDGGG